MRADNDRQSVGSNTSVLPRAPGALVVSPVGFVRGRSRPGVPGEPDVLHWVRGTLRPAEPTDRTEPISSELMATKVRPNSNLGTTSRIRIERVWKGGVGHVFSAVR